MKLTYRGVQYQPKSIGLTTVPAAETGIYRGAKLQFRKLQHPPVAIGFVILIYRGGRCRSFRYSYSALMTAEQPENISAQGNTAIAAEPISGAAMN